MQEARCNSTVHPRILCREHDKALQCTLKTLCRVHGMALKCVSRILCSKHGVALQCTLGFCVGNLVWLYSAP